jgi:hypothetical protein
MTNPFFWPGTKIVKSLNNDFNWQTGDSAFLRSMKGYLRQSRAGLMGGQATRQVFTEKSAPYLIAPAEKAFQKSITAFSKAVPTKFNGKGKKV